VSSATDRLYWRQAKRTQRQARREGRRYMWVPIGDEFHDYLVRIGRAAAGERLSDAQLAELAGLELARLALSLGDKDNRSKPG
jgi:hypothetical protein